MINLDVVYGLLAASACRRDLVNMRSILAAHGVFTVTREVTEPLRKEINDALVALYHMDVTHGRLPLSALFVLSDNKPGIGFRKLEEARLELQSTTDEYWSAYWNNLVARIYDSYALGAL